MARFFGLVFVSFFAGAANCASFINLDFELGSTNSSQVELRDVTVGLTPKKLTFGTGSVNDLFPGWTVFLGGQQTNVMAVGSGYYQWADPFRMPTYAALLNRGDYYWSQQPVPFDGNYALALDNRLSELGTTRDVVVSQAGDVPPEARFLTLRSYPEVGYFGILIDDQRFDYLDFNRAPNDSTIFGLDISGWAGRRITFGIYLPSDAPAVVDSIAFVPALDWILTIARTSPANAKPPQVTLGFGVASGRDYFVEFRDSLAAESSWQPLPGAPHNSGSVVDSSGGPQRFYRLRSVERSP